MAILMTVHGKHGGVGHIVDDALKLLTPEEIKENQRRFIELATRIFERTALEELERQEREAKEAEASVE